MNTSNESRLEQQVAEISRGKVLPELKDSQGNTIQPVYLFGIFDNLFGGLLGNVCITYEMLKEGSSQVYNLLKNKISQE